MNFITSRAWINSKISNSIFFNSNRRIHDCYRSHHSEFKVWIANSEYNGQQEIYALQSVCTHLGCTPNWLEAEQKFKCPCHGSGFYMDGINFEGPAPRPLERYAIRIASDGQIEIDSSRTFQEEMGQWSDPSCFIPV